MIFTYEHPSAKEYSIDEEYIFLGRHKKNSSGAKFKLIYLSVTE